MDYRYEITARARRDFAQIWREIAYDGRTTADGFCEQLAFKARSVTTFPYRHGTFARRPNIRKLPYKSYLIFYKIDDARQTVSILRFWHAARDQGRLRLKEEAALVYAASPSLSSAPALTHNKMLPGRGPVRTSMPHN